MSLPFSLTTAHYRWIAVLWTLGILAACSIPASSLSPIGPALSYDKLVHLALFAIFGALWMRALCPPTAEVSRSWLRRLGVRLLLLGSLFAIGTEVYQHVLPLQRMGDPYDALADGAGLGLGIGLYVLYVHRTAESKSPVSTDEGSKA
jgi:hypothetical protein